MRQDKGCRLSVKGAQGSTTVRRSPSDWGCTVIVVQPPSSKTRSGHGTKTGERQLGRFESRDAQDLPPHNSQPTPPLLLLGHSESQSP